MFRAIGLSRLYPYTGHMRSRVLVLLLVGVTISAMAVALVSVSDPAHVWADLLTTIESAGAWGPIVFVLCYVVTCVLLIPGGILTLGAGAVFGWGQGAAVVSAGSVLGAASAFLVARHLLQQRARERVSREPRLMRMIGAVESEGFRLIVLLRLVPFIPFRLSNYAFGITAVPFMKFTTATWLGTLPSALTYSYLGWFAGDLAALEDLESTVRSPLMWALYGCGAVALIVVLSLVNRAAKRAIGNDEATPQQGRAPATLHRPADERNFREG